MATEPHQKNPTDTPPNSKMKWCILRIRGRAEEIKGDVQEAIKQNNIQNIGRIETYFKRETGIKVKKRTYAYLLIEGDFTQESTREALFQTDKRIIGFVSSGGYHKKGEPLPLTQREVEAIIGRTQTNAQPNTETLQQGSAILIKGGPFQGREATIIEIDRKRQKAQVQLSNLKQFAPIELSYDQIEQK